MRLSAIASLALSGVLLATWPEAGAAQGGLWGAGGSAPGTGSGSGRG